MEPNRKRSLFPTQNPEGRPGIVNVANAVARAHKVALIREAIRQGHYTVDVPRLAEILCRHL